MLICARFNRFIPCHNYLWLAPHLYYLARLHNSFVNCTGQTRMFDRKFTVLSNGYDFCCVFKIVGTEYFWRSPGCTKRLVSCVTRASSHVAARYNAAVACTATNVYIRLGFAKRIAEVTVVSTLATVQTARIHWSSILGIAPVILLMVIIIIYGVFRFRYMFHLYADFVRYPQCANWWLCGGSTVTLMDGHVRIILHSSRRLRFAASLDLLGWCKILRGRGC